MQWCCCPPWDDVFTFALDHDGYSRHENARRTDAFLEHDRVSHIGSHPQQQSEAVVAATSAERAAPQSRAAVAGPAAKKSTAAVAHSPPMSAHNRGAAATTEAASTRARAVAGTVTAAGATATTPVPPTLSASQEAAGTVAAIKEACVEVRALSNATASTLEGENTAKAMRAWYVQVADEGGALLATAASASFPGLSLAGKTLLHVLLLQSGKSLECTPVQLCTASCGAVTQAASLSAESDTRGFENLACYAELTLYAESDQGACEAPKSEVVAAGGKNIAAVRRLRHNSVATGPFTKGESPHARKMKQRSDACRTRRRRLLHFLQRRKYGGWQSAHAYGEQPRISGHFNEETRSAVAVTEEKPWTLYVELLCQVDADYLNSAPSKEVAHFYVETVTRIKEMAAVLLRKVPRIFSVQYTPAQQLRAARGALRGFSTELVSILPAIPSAAYERECAVGCA